MVKFRALGLGLGLGLGLRLRLLGGTYFHKLIHSALTFLLYKKRYILQSLLQEKVHFAVIVVDVFLLPYPVENNNKKGNTL